MKSRSIKNINVRGKRVLLRVDFNVPVEKGKVKDDFRIRRTLPTINFLKKKRAKVILISHTTKEGLTLLPLVKYLGVKFITNKNFNLIDKEISEMKNGEVVMLENIRHYPGEKKNNKEFAKKLAKLGDIYVNDAFSVSHRQHASVVAITKYLPSYAGLLLEKEFENLSSVFNPKHPFLLILGGIKFESKLGVLDRFLDIADKIFIGGALANNFFKAQGVDIGNSVFDPEINVRKYLKNPKIILPIDLKTKKGMILDAGPATTNNLSKIIKEAKFVLWNGPLGDYEHGFKKGTLEIARAIAKSKSRSIIGGGDTIAAVRKFKIPLSKFSFVSTGGGAALEFLAKGALPGIKALEIKR